MIDILIIFPIFFCADIYIFLKDILARLSRRASKSPILRHLGSGRTIQSGEIMMRLRRCCWNKHFFRGHPNWCCSMCGMELLEVCDSFFWMFFMVSGFKMECVGYKIDFKRMKQIRVTNGKERDIRRVVPNVNPPSLQYVWEYEEAPNTWKQFDSVTSRILEGTLSQGRANLILNHGEYGKSKGGYEVNFRSLLKLQRETGKSEKIRRLPPHTSSIYGNPAPISTTQSNSNNQTTGNYVTFGLKKKNLKQR